MTTLAKSYDRGVLMEITKYLLLLANIISGLTLIPYAFGALFMFAMAHDSPNSNFINTTLPALLILSIYPTGIISCIRYSWRCYTNKRDILGVCIAYIPVIIALGIFLISGYSRFR
ncbi:hypothetical protein [Pelosinus sp. IPA-1]|uniref:hypothetical protein n=1 Tax=Pelosinus sp. IPA-1 TaxID=3029569 RepID=UPI00243622BB|nr:hypothetical protein [Pelosinus sp. IPA-1]GMA98185.1 hypothetical protein PIPA1_09850 [Pelosinus sp. IPA-1]